MCSNYEEAAEPMRQLASKQWVRVGTAILSATAFLLVARSKLQLDFPVAITFFVVGAFVVAFATFKFYPFQERLLLKGRSRMSVSEIFATYYAGSELPWGSFERHWKKTASILGEPAEILRPSDRFDNELRPRTPLDESNDDLVQYVLKQMGPRVQGDLKKTQTLDALIKLLCSLESQKSEGEADDKGK